MSLFTPVTGIIGGTLIGGSAGALLLLNGDILGMSGILSNTLINPIESIRNPKHHWRWVFLGSFCMTVNVYVNYLSYDHAFDDDRSTDSDVPIPSLLGHIIGGFLVGMGTKIGNGCTTGHGVCGLGRFSPRSLASVVTFTGISSLTTFLMSPVRAWSAFTEIFRQQSIPQTSPLASALVMAALVLPSMVSPAVDTSKSLGAALSGMMFAAGLAVSGMTKNSKIHDFLCFSNLFQHNKFDPTLMAVLGSGVISSVLSYQFIKGYGTYGKLECPIARGKESDFSGIPSNRTIDVRLLTGAVLFGVGWGIAGICPGPGLYAAAAGVVPAIVGWMPAFLLGSYAGKHVVSTVFDKKTVKKD